MNAEVNQVLLTLRQQLSSLHLRTGTIQAPSQEAQRLAIEIERLESINEGK